MVKNTIHGFDLHSKQHLYYFVVAADFVLFCFNLYRKQLVYSVCLVWLLISLFGLTLPGKSSMLPIELTYHFLLPERLLPYKVQDL